MSARRIGVLVAAVAAVSLSAAAPGPALAADKDVRVVNTVAEPVPTLAQGTTTVSGSVSVTNTPTVTLGTGASVEVNNTEAKPVPVVSVNDAREPFQTRLTFTIDPGSTQNQAEFDVPAGKRLVIEHVSSRVQGPAGQSYIAQLQTSLYTNGPSRGVHWLVLTSQGTFSSIEVFTASQPMRVYAEPSTPATMFIVTRTGSTGSSFAEVTVSGYLVAQ